MLAAGKSVCKCTYDLVRSVGLLYICRNLRFVESPSFVVILPVEADLS
jgi:hypothetical protein